MRLTEVRNLLAALVAVSLVSACASDRDRYQADSPEVIQLASAKPAANNSPGANNSYVATTANRVVMTAQSECVRTVNWAPANRIEDCAAEIPVAEPGSALVSYNGRALFDFDSATMTRTGKQQLNQLTTRLNAQDEIEAIEIVGHADSIGSDAYNQTLSENRADAVKDYLQRSLRTVSVSSTGVGESAPIADNNTDEGRRLNRRVEVIIAAVVEQ